MAACVKCVVKLLIDEQWPYFFFFFRIPEENRLKNSQTLLFFPSQEVLLGPIQRSFREIQERKQKKKKRKD